MFSSRHLDSRRDTDVNGIIIKTWQDSNSILARRVRLKKAPQVTRQ